MKRNGSKNLKGIDAETDPKTRTETGKAGRKDTKRKRGHGCHTVIVEQMEKQAEMVRNQTNLKVKTMKRTKNERKVNIEKEKRTEIGTTKIGTTLTELKAKGKICQLLQDYS